MEQPSLPSAAGCCPQNRKAPASPPWSTSPPALPGLQQQMSGDEVAGKQGTSQEGRQLHPRGISEQGFRISDSPLLWAPLYALRGIGLAGGEHTEIPA